ncbi:hypothetical protein WQ54_03775 [Bacillus sp. SA1-12]|uniref:DUF72 domain-containing protein n=1 Tax=Bacillus sp. SA1-12 TaxID=1455638 RepID=UPI000625FBEB|nr:DUF72 domain-containing protein [Bacillus sp. SA1-12]KKI93367.1 hypothetical protein WQ54_03775 [Bacillus sp. SA1-12]
MSTIQIGLTGWGDHDSLYPLKTNTTNKLQEYAAHFPTVEIDASFYAVQPERNIMKWINDTPDTFQFIPKAYQGMTGHLRGDIPFEYKETMFKAYIQSLVPLKKANKLAMVLFQFPPWYDCRKENVSYLKWCREQMADFDVALEFRNRTWFSPEYHDKTLQFMEAEKWIHSIVDEPQAGERSIPAVLHPTDPAKTLIRFHGRNVHGWNKPASGDNWRDVRYLYRYNREELLEWKQNLHSLQKATDVIYLLFNNNSGGDAADNAKMMMNLLDISYSGLAEMQLSLFSDEEER